MIIRRQIRLRFATGVVYKICHLVYSPTCSLFVSRSLRSARNPTLRAEPAKLDKVYNSDKSNEQAESSEDRIVGHKWELVLRRVRRSELDKAPPGNSRTWNRYGIDHHWRKRFSFSGKYHMVSESYV